MITRASTHPRILTSPNILVLSNTDNEFNDIKQCIQDLLGKNSYTIYKLNFNELIESKLWMKNCCLLISFENDNESKIKEKTDSFIDFLQIGGKILSLPSSNQDKLTNKIINDKYEINLFEKNFYIEREYDESRLINRILESDILPVGLVRYVLNSNNESQGAHLVSKLTQSTSVLKKYLKDDLNKNSSFLENNEKSSFDNLLYFSNLKTQKLGSILLYSDIVGSTMNTFDYLPQTIDNLIVVARQQTQGQGNNKNEWLSPIGCCMFTLFLNLKSESFPMSRLSLLQFVAALSCVKSVVNSPGHENIPLRIKWPNDVYFNGTTKIGGILAKSSLFGSIISVKIGVGFNLNNEHPTDCLNRILRLYNLPERSPEIFISSFLSEFEKLLNLLTRTGADDGVGIFLKDIQDHWLHTNQKVLVNHWNEEVLITGLDEYGFLKVKRTDNTEHSLQPDGNRFDLMHNMIVLRT